MNKVALVAGAVACCAAAVWIVIEFLPRSPSTGQPGMVHSPEQIARLRAKADGGDAASQCQLGRIYAKGEGLPQSYVEAGKWYQRAAEQGNADGQTALGELCEAGQGVPRDPAQAAKWYHLAAEQGHVGAEYSLGALYEFGRGVPRDQVQAARWYREAAEQGDSLAQFNLGQRYDLGIGVAVDHIESFKWLSLAARQGIKDAETARDRVRATLSREETADGKHRAASFVPKKGRPAPTK
jgi:TPR repeat protein